MGRGTHGEGGWGPLLGSYEEAVLSWHEQVEKAFVESRRHEMMPGNQELLGDQVLIEGPVTQLRAAGRLP